MKKIQIKDDYNITDFGEVSEINKIIEKINIGTETVVELNLRHCFIEYPGTSYIFDKIFDQLRTLSGPKELVVIFDYYLPESNILNLCFMGSKYFDIEEDKEDSLDTITKKIKEKIVNDNIIIEIRVVNRNGEQINSYKYGE
ncbi:MAG: hypothetical protein PHS48_02655 [Bacteroidales bacterium]|nr:hypothetical protein [Bacteroidales bacterium]